MSLFRRREETLNEQLLREASIPAAGPAEPPGRGPSRPLHREREIVTRAEAPGLPGDTYGFIALGDGSLIADCPPDEDLSPLADAIEEHLPPPYRATAARHGDGGFGVRARQIEVATLDAAGDEIGLVSIAGERTYTVDGEEAHAGEAPPGLAELGSRVGSDYAASAARIDGDLWEVRAGAL